MISDIVRHPLSTWAVNFTSFAARSPRIQHSMLQLLLCRVRCIVASSGITTAHGSNDFRHIHGFRHQILQIRVIDNSRIIDDQSMIMILGYLGHSDLPSCPFSLRKSLQRSHSLQAAPAARKTMQGGAVCAVDGRWPLDGAKQILSGPV